MSSIFDLAEVEFRFTGNHTAVLETGVEAVRIEVLQIYAVLGKSGIRVVVKLAHPIQKAPVDMSLLHAPSGFRVSLIPDHQATRAEPPGPGSTHLYLEPADHLANTTLTQWLQSSAHLVQ